MKQASRDELGARGAVEGENVIWTKFYTDHLLGTQNATKGQLVPEMAQQYIRGAPSVDEADYVGSDGHA